MLAQPAKREAIFPPWKKEKILNGCHVSETPGTRGRNGVKIGPCTKQYKYILVHTTRTTTC